MRRLKLASKSATVPGTRAGVPRRSWIRVHPRVHGGVFRGRAARAAPAGAGRREGAAPRPGRRERLGSEHARRPEPRRGLARSTDAVRADAGIGRGDPRAGARRPRAGGEPRLRDRGRGDDGRVSLGGRSWNASTGAWSGRAARPGVDAIDDGLERHRRPSIPGCRTADLDAPGAAPGARCTDIMKTNPQSVREDDPLRLAADIMAAANIGFLPVCDDGGKVVGTITDRDIVVRAVAQSSIPRLARVSEMMSRNVVSCRPDDELALAEQFMAQYQVSRLAVTDDDDIIGGRHQPLGHRRARARGARGANAPFHRGAGSARLS